MVDSTNLSWLHTQQKMKFSIKDFFGKCDQIRSFLGIWSHLLKKSLMENFIFCALAPFYWLTVITGKKLCSTQFSTRIY